MILETIPVGPLQVNCYLLAADENSSAIIIDPGGEERKIRRQLERHRLTAGMIVNTHGHYDHIGADDKFGLPVYIHKDDLGLLKDPKLNLSGTFFMPHRVDAETKALEDGSVIGLGGIELKVIHIPGHTPGGIALLMQKPQGNILFSGDALFLHGIGRSDFEYGSEEKLLDAIKKKILTLPGETIVYPGHGPSTTIKEEKENNPFLVDSNSHIG